jgi:hypothetical protein
MTKAKEEIRELSESAEVKFIKQHYWIGVYLILNYIKNIEGGALIMVILRIMMFGFQEIHQSIQN